MIEGKSKLFRFYDISIIFSTEENYFQIEKVRTTKIRRKQELWTLKEIGGYAKLKTTLADLNRKGIY